MSTESRTVVESEHYVHLSIHMRVPNGLYIPIEPPLSDDERKSIDSESLCAGVEMMHYINDLLEGLGIKMEGISIMDTYTLETTVKR